MPAAAWSLVGLDFGKQLTYAACTSVVLCCPMHSVPHARDCATISGGKTTPSTAVPTCLVQSLCSALLCRAVLCCAVSQAWDLAIGAAAGVASVLVSMPMDVIKTYMQTHHGAGAAPGMAGQLAAFWQTGGAWLLLLGYV